MNKILYDDSNNPLNDKEYDHEDHIIYSKHYTLVNRTKTEYISKNAKKPLKNDKTMTLTLVAIRYIKLRYQN